MSDSSSARRRRRGRRKDKRTRMAERESRNVTVPGVQTEHQLHVVEPVPLKKRKAISVSDDEVVVIPEDLPRSPDMHGEETSNKPETTTTPDSASQDVFVIDVDALESSSECIEILDEDDSSVKVDEKGVKVKRKSRRGKSRGRAGKKRNRERNESDFHQKIEERDLRQKIEMSHERRKSSDERIRSEEKEHEMQQLEGNGQKEAAANDERSYCVRLEDSILLVLEHPCQLIVSGSVSLKCVMGQVQVNGYNLDPAHSDVDVFSPSVCSRLTIATQSCGTGRNKQTVVEDLKRTNGLYARDKLERILEQVRFPVIIEIMNAKLHLSNTKVYTNTFSQAFHIYQDSRLDALLNPFGVTLDYVKRSYSPYVHVQENVQSVLEEWNSQVNNYCKGNDPPPVIMICGSKGTGKSTTNRLLINNTLNNLDCVYFLDCDVGQSEFMPPGCVSLVKVAEPVLGPPFTHQRKPECCYLYGGLTPVNNPDMYMECLIQCVQHYRGLLHRAPLIINTMGWIEDLGLELLVDTVRLTHPTHIIQFQARLGDDMIEKLFSTDSWTDKSSKQFPQCKPSEEMPVPKCLYIKPKTREIEYRHANARELRELSMFGYFYQNLEPGLSLNSVSPYSVSWSDVAVHICHNDVSQSQIMYALNASLVALCHADLTKTDRPYEEGPLFFTEVPLFTWIGYGIVRGIDMQKKLLYIITPLTSEELNTVNTIVKGLVMLPDQVLLNTGLPSLPYVDTKITSYGGQSLQPKKRPKYGIPNK